MRTRVVVARPMPDLVTERLSVVFDPVLADRPGLDPATVIERAMEHDAEARVITSDLKLGATEIEALPPSLEGDAALCPKLAAMLPRTETLTLHLPGGPATNRMLNAETFALLPNHAVFVNAARGRLVDEDSLLDALSSGHLAAAGLDVFATEPDFDRRLAERPNVFLMPHIGTSTRENRNAMRFRALDNIAAVCAARPPIDPLW